MEFTTDSVRGGIDFNNQLRLGKEQLKRGCSNIRYLNISHSQRKNTKYFSSAKLNVAKSQYKNGTQGSTQRNQSKMIRKIL